MKLFFRNILPINILSSSVTMCLLYCKFSSTGYYPLKNISLNLKRKNGISFSFAFMSLLESWYILKIIYFVGHINILTDDISCHIASNFFFKFSLFLLILFMVFWRDTEVFISHDQFYRSFSL